MLPLSPPTGAGTPGGGHDGRRLSAAPRGHALLHEPNEHRDGSRQAELSCSIPESKEPGAPLFLTAMNLSDVQYKVNC